METVRRLKKQRTRCNKSKLLVKYHSALSKLEACVLASNKKWRALIEIAAECLTASSAELRLLEASAELIRSVKSIRANSFREVDSTPPLNLAQRCRNTPAPSFEPQ
jgi:hypothetical protein